MIDAQLLSYTMRACKFEPIDVEINRSKTCQALRSDGRHRKETFVHWAFYITIMGVGILTCAWGMYSIYFRRHPVKLVATILAPLGLILFLVGLTAALV